MERKCILKIREFEKHPVYICIYVNYVEQLLLAQQLNDLIKYCYHFKYDDHGGVEIRQTTQLC